jgi:hypothetical protein
MPTQPTAAQRMIGDVRAEAGPTHRRLLEPSRV